MSAESLSSLRGACDEAIHMPLFFYRPVIGNNPAEFNDISISKINQLLACHASVLQSMKTKQKP